MSFRLKRSEMPESHNWELLVKEIPVFARIEAARPERSEEVLLGCALSECEEVLLG